MINWSWTNAEPPPPAFSFAIILHVCAHRVCRPVQLGRNGVVGCVGYGRVETRTGICETKEVAEECAVPSIHKI